MRGSVYNGFSTLDIECVPERRRKIHFHADTVQPLPSLEFEWYLGDRIAAGHHLDDLRTLCCDSVQDSWWIRVLLQAFLKVFAPVADDPHKHPSPPESPARRHTFPAGSGQCTPGGPSWSSLCKLNCRRRLPKRRWSGICALVSKLILSSHWCQWFSGIEYRFRMIPEYSMRLSI